MPGMGGLELQKRMLTEAPTLPVIVLSATTDVDSALKAMRHRAVDFIRKPFDADELLRAIQSAVIQNQAMRSVEEERKGAQLRFGELSQGEQDLLLLLSEGMAEQQIAQSIGVPAGQLQGMLESLCTRMNAASMIELVQLSLLVGSEVSRERLPGVVAGVVTGVVTGVAAGEVGSTLSAATKAAA